MTSMPHLVLSPLRTGARARSENEETHDKGDVILRAHRFPVNASEYWFDYSGVRVGPVFVPTKFREDIGFAELLGKERLSSIVGYFDDSKIFQIVDGKIRVVGRVSDKPHWAQEIEDLGHGHPTSDQLIKIIRTLKGLMNERDYWQISVAFTTINVARVSIEGLIALLRTTYAARSSIDTWRAFLDSCRQEIIKRGHNPEDIIFGLG
jgi:hypothetical protein